MAAAGMKTFRVVGAPISVLDMPRAVENIERWIAEGRGGYVCVADVHNVMRARKDESHAAAISGADMVTPDGLPLVWFGRLRGEGAVRRVCGPDLMLELAAASVPHHWKHFLYGGREGVPGQLSDALCDRFPGLEIVGAISPPFRALTPEEDAEVVRTINSSGADIVWVGLGCPKQERWMAEHRKVLPRSVLVGVGAAFDFHSGRIRRAPRWMQGAGLEWLHRLASDPGRLWRRYLVSAPLFLLLAIRDLLARESPASPPKGGDAGRAA